jgi:FkbM family methyltransferase
MDIVGVAGRNQALAGALRRRSVPLAGPRAGWATTLRQWRAALGRTRRRMIERFASAVVRGLAWNKRIRRTMLRQIYTDYLPHDRLCLAPFADHAFFVSPRDLTIGYELMSGKPWQRDELDRAIAALETAGALKSGGIFLDVGANIGTQTVYAMLSGRFSGAVAIEPEAANFAILERNVALNGYTDSVKCLLAAACARAGDVTLRINRANAGGHSVSARHLRSPGSEVVVRGAPVDELIVEAGVDAQSIGLAWIDVEGLETDVLAGMTTIRAAATPIVFEYSVKSGDEAAWARLKQMFAADYDRCVILNDGGTGAVQVLEDIPAPRDQVDVLVFKMPASGAFGAEARDG